MKIWTFDEMRSKVQNDDDLNDETFIVSDELIGYFNDAIDDAEALIHKLSEDYFLTKYFVPLSTGVSTYELPLNIYGQKIRSILYNNGSEVYEVAKFKRKPGMFSEMALIDNAGSSDQYRYLLLNNIVGQCQLELKPASRETAVFSSSLPMVMWYLRNANRVPVLGEYCNPEIVAYSAVDAGTDIITVKSGTKNYGIPQQWVSGAYPGSIAYITGDTVKLKAAPGGSLPAPLVEDTVYYVIAASSTTIKLATSRANALAGTAINLTTQGTVGFKMEVAATANIISATLIDIPEYANYIMQYVKCRAMSKEGDPRLSGEAGEAQVLVDMRKSMIDTLTGRVDDDDTTVPPDTSFYEDMN